MPQSDKALNCTAPEDHRRRQGLCLSQDWLELEPDQSLGEKVPHCPRLAALSFTRQKAHIPPATSRNLTVLRRSAAFHSFSCRS